MPELNLVLLGPPGSGKGTQGERLNADLRLPYYATGDILRGAVRDETELGKSAKAYMDAGDLVPDEVTIGIVRDRLAQDDVANGFLLDGFPRTVPQAEALNGMLADLGRPLDVVLEMQVDDAEIVRRLSGRRTCRTCGHIWHIEFDPPAKEGICDIDGGELFQRDDDQPATIQRRLDVFTEQTAPLIGFYSELGLLTTIPALGKVDEITQRAIKALEAAKG